MKKADFVDALSKQINKTKRETNQIVDEFSKLIMGALRRGDEIGLDIGKFKLKQRPARVGMNPFTQQRIALDAKVVPTFKPSKKFKEAILE